MIKVGDTVSVCMYESAFTLSGWAEVLNVPAASGEPWGFLDIHKGNEFWTNERVTVLVLKRKDA